MLLRITTILVVLISTSFGIVSAATECANTGKITDTSFKLNLGCMDALDEGQKIAGKSGIDVLVVLLKSISDILLFTIPVIAVVSLLVAGYFYIFSAGDSEKVGRAKTIIKWNIIAILVAFLSYGIIRLIASFFA